MTSTITTSRIIAPMRRTMSFCICIAIAAIAPAFSGKGGRTDAGMKADAMERNAQTQPSVPGPQAPAQITARINAAWAAAAKDVHPARLDIPAKRLPPSRIAILVAGN